MRFIDFFSGAGGERRGMELAGHTCIGFCEYDKYARASYLSMHCMTEEQRRELKGMDLKSRQKRIWANEREYANGEWYSTDIVGLHGDELPRAECWIFSAPCTSFSIAGKRAGLDGESGLVMHVFRLLDEVGEENKPEWLIYENVKGMLSSTGGFDFLAILLEMDRGGGTISNGVCVIPSISEFRKTENVSTLSGILEDSVPEKYFLSREQMEKIILDK